MNHRGEGSYSSVIAGIEWASNNNIKVINMSLGGGAHSQALKNAVDAAYAGGAILIAAAGNDGSSTDNVLYPARYSSVIAVSASDSNNKLASFSSRGPSVELIAPGVNIKSLYPGNYMVSWSGTSMASPHVAGSAAVLWGADTSLSNVQVRQLLRDTAQNLGLSADNQGYGLVRPDLAVNEISDASGIVKPGSFMATAVSTNQIDLGWNLNAGNNSVMLAWSADGVFGTPIDGTIYSASESIPGGGTVLYTGSNTSYGHTALNHSTTYYYRAFSYDASNQYSTGSSASVATLMPPISSFPWTETFEDNSPTRTRWTQAQVSGSKTWTFANGSGGGNITTAYQGTKNARFTGTPNGPYITKLISPTLDLSGLSNPGLSFWYGQQSYAGDQNEIKVYYRTSPTANWVQIFHDTANRSSWTEKNLALPNPSTAYQIAFEGIDRWGYANVLDNVMVINLIPPSSPILDQPEEGASVETTAINFSWQAVSGANSYQLDVSRSSDFALGSMIYSADLGNVTSKSVSVEFTQGTYYWRVRAYNQTGWSNWSGVRSFEPSFRSGRHSIFGQSRSEPHSLYPFYSDRFRQPE